MASCDTIKFAMIDAIHPDDHQRFNEYMDLEDDNTFTHMYPKDGKVIIDMYRGPPDKLERREEFKPSDIADEYWAEERRIIKEMDKAGLMNKDPGPIPGAKVPGI